MTFARYILIQSLAYGIDMGSFVILLYFRVIDPVVANAIAKFLAGIFAFVAHRRFTFPAAESMSAREQAIRYFVLLVLNMPVASAILFLLLMLFSEIVLAKFIADIVCVGLTYLLSKYLIFTGRSKQRNSNSAGVSL